MLSKPVRCSELVLCDAPKFQLDGLRKALLPAGTAGEFHEIVQQNRRIFERKLGLVTLHEGPVGDVTVGRGYQLAVTHHTLSGLVPCQHSTISSRLLLLVSSLET